MYVRARFFFYDCNVTSGWHSLEDILKKNTHIYVLNTIMTTRSRLKLQLSEQNSEETKGNGEEVVEYVEEHATQSKYFKRNKESAPAKAKEPPLWREQLENIRKMREKQDAPVDTMGCDKLSDEKAAPKDFRFQCLLALMLSSQTKDQVTSSAMSKLIEHGCSAENLLKAPAETIEKLIYPVSFYKTKAKNILKVSEILNDKYEGDIPKTVQELCELPGVGPKMAHLTMQSAWGEVTGIAADTHVHRISNRLNWVNTKSPLKTQIELEEWVPKELWGELNHILVGFGQQICLPVRPKCSECCNRGICPSAAKETRPKKKM